MSISRRTFWKTVGAVVAAPMAWLRGSQNALDIGPIVTADSSQWDNCLSPEEVQQLKNPVKMTTWWEWFPGEDWCFMHEHGRVGYPVYTHDEYNVHIAHYCEWSEELDEAMLAILASSVDRREFVQHDYRCLRYIPGAVIGYDECTLT